MSSDKERVELMYKRFPKCPLCKSDKGYGFSGWIDDFAECVSCKAKWKLLSWFSEDAKMELVKVSRDPMKRTVIGHELLGKIYPTDFWQKIKRLQVKAKEVGKETEIPEAKEVREETIPPKPTVSMPVIIVILVLILIVIVAGIGVYYSQMESQKKPKFNVFDVRLLDEGIAVYIQNTGNKDAHGVTIETSCRGYDGDASTYGELEILKASETRKIITEKTWSSYNFDIPTLDIFRVTVTVTCKEGVSQEFIFEVVD